MRRFVRDIDLHGHHRECDCSLEAMDRDERHVCTCEQLDDDDWREWLDHAIEDRGERYD